MDLKKKNIFKQKLLGVICFPLLHSVIDLQPTSFCQVYRIELYRNPEDLSVILRWGEIRKRLLLRSFLG